MKRLLVITSLLIGTSAFGHGAIEDISCEDSQQGITLKGVETKKNNVLKFSLSQKGKTVLKDVVAELALKDTVKGSQVYEEVTIKLPKGESVLSVLEDYSKEVREGTGRLAVNSVTTKNLKCKVTY